MLLIRIVEERSATKPAGLESAFTLSSRNACPAVIAPMAAINLRLSWFIFVSP